MSYEVITLGGGCFWCIEAIFRATRGVVEVVSGYSGGRVISPSYEQVCTGETGHAEVVEVTFDLEQVSLDVLLEIFFFTHDPTTLNRQGADVGTQYRSVLFYRNEAQRVVAERIKSRIQAEHIFEHPLVTEIVLFTQFFPAESYHQRYFEKHPESGYCQVVISPKIAQFRKKFADRLNM